MAKRPAKSDSKPKQDVEKASSSKKKATPAKSASKTPVKKAATKPAAKKAAPKKAAKKAVAKKPAAPKKSAAPAGNALFQRLSASIQKAAAAAGGTKPPSASPPPESAKKSPAKKTASAKKATPPKKAAAKVAVPPKATPAKRTRSTTPAPPPPLPPSMQTNIARLRSSIKRAAEISRTGTVSATASATATRVTARQAAPPQVYSAPVIPKKSSLLTAPQSPGASLAPGGSHLVLLARDPDWLYAYWDISGADRNFHQLGALHGSPIVFLRMHALNANGSLAAHGSFDAMITPDAGNWLIQIPRIERDWLAEMGYIGRDGGFVSITSSNRLSSPYTEPQPEPAPRQTAFAETSDELSDAELEMNSQFLLTLPDVDSLQFFPSPYPTIEPRLPPWPVVPRHDIHFADMPPQVFNGHTNAALEPVAIPGASEQYMRAPALEVLPAPAPAPFLQEFPPIGASDLVARRPGAPAPSAGKDFWLWVKTELIVYGATEPDASLTVQDLPVTLRPDGTFTVRFALPEGDHAYPVRAVNRDGDMEKKIIPTVKRRTED